jgi:RHS repeat-associated protein
VRIDFPDLTSAAYRYDADGRRIEKGVNGAITRYLYDDDDIILEYDGTNTLAAKYSHGIEVDQPLVQERGGQSFFYHVDHLGSVRKLTNAAGAITNTYDTEAFGRFETRLEAVANPYTFTAREFDPESGLHFYRARYYDPFAGRFLGADPIGFNSRDLNLYRYVYNDPINFVDPFGEAAAIERCLLGGVAGAIAESLAFVGARAGGVFALIAAVLDPNAANVLPPTNEVGGEAAVGFFAGCLIGLANPATVPREAIIHEGFLIGLALGVIKGSK